MFRKALHHPWIYTFTQWLWYRSGQQERYVQEWIRPETGDRILDIGCGPARLLDRLPEVEYVGYDPNSDYIVDAAARFGVRGRFYDQGLAEICAREAGRFDIVLANGVLHHVADDAAKELLTLAARALKPRGRMVTRDGCYEDGQSMLARSLLKSDRGRFVRTSRGYDELVREKFDVARSAILRDALRLPYSLIQYDLIKK